VREKVCVVSVFEREERRERKRVSECMCVGERGWEREKVCAFERGQAIVWQERERE